MNEKIEKKKGAITMYNENDYNKYQGGGSRQDQNTDSDLDYTEGSYSDSTSSRQTDRQRRIRNRALSTAQRQHRKQQMCLRKLSAAMPF